jgi:hypothetical protein
MLPKHILWPELLMKPAPCAQQNTFRASRSGPATLSLGYPVLRSWPVRRICVDMDEVMADTLGEHLRRYNQAFDEDVTPQDLVGKGLMGDCAGRPPAAAPRLPRRRGFL